MIRSAFTLIAALAATPLRAAEPAPPPPVAAPAPSPAPVARAARPGERGLFLLRDGRTFAGELVSSGPDGDVIELSSGERLRFAPGSVAGTVEIPAAPAPEPPPRPGVVRVFLRDGRVVEGRAVDAGSRGVRLEVASGEILTFPAEEIREVLPVDDLRRDRGGPLDPARSRYLAVPSALALGRGEYAMGASGAEPAWAAAGVTGWLQVSAGATLPLQHGRTSPLGGSAAATAHWDLAPWLEGAAGARVVSGAGATTGHLFASVTAGSPARHLTLHAGPPLPASGRLGDFPATVIALAGTTRVVGDFALVGEGWVSPRSGASPALGAAAIRYVARHLAFDAGAMVSTRGSSSPWFAITWTGGRGTP